MRITKKTDTKEGTTIGMPKAIKAYWKLKELEDIEEELGISLDILFKALKNGFYEIQFKSLWEYGIKTSGKDACKSLDLENHRFFVPESAEGPAIINDFKDYGKTWSLRKEDLE